MLSREGLAEIWKNPDKILSDPYASEEMRNYALQCKRRKEMEDFTDKDDEEQSQD